MEEVKYKIIEEKGHGGFGVVHVIEREGKQEALKTFQISSAMADITDELRELTKKRFIKEATYLQDVTHKNIVPVLKLVLDKDPPSFIMPLAEASMFQDIVSGKIHNGNYVECLLDIMAGLEELHALGIFHRDLKPANVLRFVDADGKEFYAISDFGLMSLNSTGITTLTKTGVSKTSDKYTAPEITTDLKYASAQSDLYSLACILHDFVKSGERVVCNEISETTEFGDLLRIATRNDPKRRFKDVASFREAFMEVLRTPAKPKTQAAQEALDVLNKDILSFSDKDIRQIGDFLSSNVNDEDKKGVLDSITLDHVKLIKNDPNHGKFIGKAYCDYVRNSPFPYEFCDSLAIKIEEFITDAEIDLKIEGIFALLYMGTRHNRWYVERKVLKYFCDEIESRLLQRMRMEMRADETKFCKAIAHLMHSINVSIGRFNPEIQETIKKFCL